MAQGSNAQRIRVKLNTLEAEPRKEREGGQVSAGAESVGPDQMLCRIPRIAG